MQQGKLQAGDEGRILPYAAVGSGPHVLLLIPGALGLGSVDMAPLLDTLDKSKYTMIAVDMHGCYASSPERDWTIDAGYEDALDCHTTMLSLGFGHRGKQKTDVSGKDETSGASASPSRPYSVLGWCNGATTGLILAAKWPSSVRRLVVWGGKAHVTSADVELYSKFRDFDSWPLENRRSWTGLLGERRGRIVLLASCDLVQRVFEERNGFLVEPQLLASIVCRTLVLHGDRDTLVPCDHAELLRSSISNVQVRIWPEGKHNLLKQDTQLFCTIVDQFLSDD